MLIQLPTGDQINPLSVQSIRIWPAADAGLQVIVEYGAGGMVSVPVTYGLDGTQLRDRIAESVNAACYEAREARRG